MFSNLKVSFFAFNILFFSQSWAFSENYVVDRNLLKKGNYWTWFYPEIEGERPRTYTIKVENESGERITLAKYEDGTPYLKIEVNYDELLKYYEPGGLDRIVVRELWMWDLSQWKSYGQNKKEFNGVLTQFDKYLNFDDFLIKIIKSKSSYFRGKLFLQ